MSHLEKQIEEAIKYTDKFLEYYRQDDPDELEEPQDMLEHIKSVLLEFECVLAVRNYDA